MLNLLEISKRMHSCSCLLIVRRLRITGQPSTPGVLTFRRQCCQNQNSPGKWVQICAFYPLSANIILIFAIRSDLCYLRLPRWHFGEYYPDAKEAVDAVLKGWFNDAPAYTLQSVYDSAPKF